MIVRVSLIEECQHVYDLQRHRKYRCKGFHIISGHGLMKWCTSIFSYSTSSTGYKRLDDHEFLSFLSGNLQTISLFRSGTFIG